MELAGYRDFLARYGKKHLALYHALRAAILEGRLRDGERLPPGRELAGYYGLSRGTVNIAYEMLTAEGYLRARVGSGSYVSFPGAPRPPARTPRPVKPSFSRRSSRLPKVARVHASPSPPEAGSAGKIPHFVIGQPDATAFPERAWKQCVQQALRDLDYLGAAARENEIFGYRPLRAAVAAHLNRERGLSLSADEICIVNGSIQAIALLTDLLVDPGTPVVVENPGYAGIREAVRAAGGRLIPVAVDADGMRPTRRRARLIFVTPSNQFPTGQVLSLQRRLELLDRARKDNAIIVEDDYDSEFHRARRPIEPLKALDEEQGRVVLLGSFSKTISPALRLGYAALPPALIEPFALIRQLYETLPGGLIEQAAVADFMKSGAYDRHLRAMIKLYDEKRDSLARLLEERLPGAFDWNAGAAGLHLFGRWRRSERAFETFARGCRRQGLFWTDPRRYYARDYRPAVALGFSHLSAGEMERAVAIMAGEIRRPR